MILTVTDFGLSSPYLAQMRAALLRAGAACPIIDLVADLDPFNIPAAAHFLASQISWFPQQSLFLAVVDPGVGGDRDAIALLADGQWFIGPDNGLLDVVAARANAVQHYTIAWRPERLSASFHGRDLFAPVAASLSTGTLSEGLLLPCERSYTQQASAELNKVIYIDRYGNGMTGVRSDTLTAGFSIQVNGVQLPSARTFSDLPQGAPFCYSNSVGLVEIAANCANAAAQLELSVGMEIQVLESGEAL